MRSVSPLPEALVGTVFTFAAARAAGTSRGTLRSTLVRRLAPGVYCDARMAGSIELRYWAAQEWAGAAVAFGTTSLALLGHTVPHFMGGDERVHLAVPAAFPGRPAPPGVVVHRVSASPASVRLAANERLWITVPQHAWVQAAQQGLSAEQLVILGDRLVARRASCCTLPDLVECVSQARGRPGAPALRRAVRLVRLGTDSVMESWLRLEIVRVFGIEPEVNREVFDEYGRFIATVDLSFPSWRIAIFYDGDLHRTSARQWRKDQDDNQDLAAAGWGVIR